MTARAADTAPGPEHTPAGAGAGVPSATWRTSVPLLAAGGVAIVVGGLTAAVTGPTGWEHGSWVAAFVVLVTGVAQVGLGFGQDQLGTTPMTIRFAVIECVLWNTGCLIVVIGTLLSSPVAVSIGSAPLLAVLAMSTFVVRRPAPQPGLAAIYRALLVVLLVSVPVGIALAWTRS